MHNIKISNALISVVYNANFDVETIYPASALFRSKSGANQLTNKFAIK